MGLFKRFRRKGSFDIETTLHGSRKYCPQFHPTTPIGSQFSQNRNHPTPIRCQDCGDECLCLGGLYPRESVALQESLPPSGARKLDLQTVWRRQRGGSSRASSALRSRYLDINSPGESSRDHDGSDALRSVRDVHAQQEPSTGTTTHDIVPSKVPGLKKSLRQQISRLMTRISHKLSGLRSKASRNLRNQREEDRIVKMPAADQRTVSAAARLLVSDQTQTAPDTSGADFAEQPCLEYKEHSRNVGRLRTEDGQQEAAWTCRDRHCACYPDTFPIPAVGGDRSSHIPIQDLEPNPLRSQADTPLELRYMRGGTSTPDDTLPRRSDLSLTERTSLASTVVEGAERRQNEQPDRTTRYTHSPTPPNLETQRHDFAGSG